MRSQWFKLALCVIQIFERPQRPTALQINLTNGLAIHVITVALFSFSHFHRACSHWLAAASWCKAGVLGVVYLWMHLNAEGQSTDVQ